MLQIECQIDFICENYKQTTKYCQTSYPQLYDIIDKSIKYKPMWIFILIIVAIIVVIALVYNSLIRSRNRVEESWADIEVQLKRRYDLIPNLVNTVKGYATHESTAFEKVTAARSAATRSA